MKRLLLAASIVLFASQGQKPIIDSARLSQPPTDSWPTYNGDYSGRRFSPLDEDQRHERRLAQPGVDVPAEHRRPGSVARSKARR